MKGIQRTTYRMRINIAVESTERLRGRVFQSEVIKKEREMSLWQYREYLKCRR